LGKVAWCRFSFGEIERRGQYVWIEIAVQLKSCCLAPSGKTHFFGQRRRN
jgi:hypothetical protein